MGKNLNNSHGQFVIETVLMMLVTISLFIWGTNYLRQKKYIAKLVGEPWHKVAGMIESGVWEGEKTARQKHPNSRDRSLTYDPDK